MTAARVIKGIIGGMVTAEGAIHHSRPFFDDDIYSTMMWKRKTTVMNGSGFKRLLDRNGAASIRLYPSGHYGMRGDDTDSRFVAVRGIIDKMPDINITSRWVASEGLNTVDRVMANAMENFSQKTPVGNIKPSEVYNIWTSETTRAGGNFGGYYKTKKFYQGTEPLSLTVQMKVVDWNGTGQPAATAVALLQYMVPYTRNGNESEENKAKIRQLIERMIAGGIKVVEGGVQQISDIVKYGGGALQAAGENLSMVTQPATEKIDTATDPLQKLVKSGANAIKNLITDAVEGVIVATNTITDGNSTKLADATVKNVKKVGAGILEAGSAVWDLTKMQNDRIMQSKELLNKSMIDEISENIADQMTLRYSPPTVGVMIGEYFSHDDMILKGITLSFSKKMTTAGPLWLDATLNLETRKAIDSYEYTGFILSQDETAVANMKQAYEINEDGSSDASFMSLVRNES